MPSWVFPRTAHTKQLPLKVVIKRSLLPQNRQMAWFSHGDSSNESMVKALRNNGIIHSQEVENGMKAVDRAHFVTNKSWAYFDSPSPIGHNATISAPHMHAYALELLRDHLIHDDAKVLDVGSGSGYLTACFAKMVAGRGGSVVGIEHIPELTEMSKANISKDRSLVELERRGALKLITGDGRLGYPEDAPYDAIHVGAAAAELPPALIQQLKPGGRMVCPCGEEDDMQYLAVIDKKADGSVEREDVMGVRYVPLTNKEHQLSLRR